MKSVNPIILAAMAGAAVASFSGPAAAADPMSGQASSSMTGQKDAQSVISSWPDKTKKAALALIEKYGPPDGITDRLLAWNDKEQWKMVGVFRDAVPHNEPAPHEDFIENKISYQMPAELVGALASFDRALVVDQTRGTLASHCDSEKSNILALNLANEIVTGKRDVASAKSFLKKEAAESMAGKSSPYTDGLMFTPSPSVESQSRPGSKSLTPAPGIVQPPQPNAIPEKVPSRGY